MIKSVIAAPQVTLLMRTLSDPTRRAIYERIITAREATVVALTQHAGVSQPAVSQHLKALQDAKLVSGRRDGRNTFYHATAQGLAPLTRWLQHYEQYWMQSFDRLDDYLTELQRGKKKRGRRK
jgi:DNA-binding transcriptional ArsR family regulator